MKKFVPLLAIAMVLCMCKKTLPPVNREYYFKNILFLGNATTLAPPNPLYQWYGNWGMAATVADSDYVHILTENFRGFNTQCIVSVKNIADFEFHFDSYDVDKELKATLSTKIDLVIIQIEGSTFDFDHALYEQRYAALINYIKNAAPNASILAVGSFWSGRDDVNLITKKYYAFTTLKSLNTDISNFAWGLFPNLDVQSHASNKGMKAIANIIWASVDSIRKTRPFVQ